MRRRIVTAAIAVLLAGGAMGPPSNAQEAQQHESRRERQCRFQWVDRGTWTAAEERLTTECVLARWPTPGGRAVFDCIIGHESGWNRLAYNPAGPYVGLGQHVLSSWFGRVAAYRPHWWTLRSRWRNSRTNITVTARMMVDQGIYGPWPNTSRACT